MSAPKLLSRIIDEIDANGWFNMPLGLVRHIRHPVKRPPWLFTEGYTAEDLKQAVAACIQTEDLCGEPWQRAQGDNWNAFSAPLSLHAGRIAWLVVNGWDDPITLDFGEEFHPASGPVSDGNHRLYAAMFRGDASIKATHEGSLSAGIEMIEWVYKEASGRYRLSRGLPTPTAIKAPAKLTFSPLM